MVKRSPAAEESRSSKYQCDPPTDSLSLRNLTAPVGVRSRSKPTQHGRQDLTLEFGL